MVLLRCGVAMIGDATSGKTALVKTFISGASGYPKNYVMTPGCQIQHKTVKVQNQDAQVQLQIIDTGGQTIYNDIAKEMVSRANAIIFVYDLTSPESLNSMEYWLNYVKDVLRERPFIGVLVGAKSDMNNSGYDIEERMKFIRDHRFEYVETSAAKMMNIETPFQVLAQAFAASYFERVSQLDSMV